MNNLTLRLLSPVVRGSQVLRTIEDLIASRSAFVLALTSPAIGPAAMPLRVALHYVCDPDADCDGVVWTWTVAIIMAPGDFEVASREESLRDLFALVDDPENLLTACEDRGVTFA